MLNGISSLPDTPGYTLPNEQPKPSPLTVRGRPTSLTALSEPQRRFAADHHSLIYSFLRERHLQVGEYYDIVVLGFLHAVQRYLTQPALGRYKFSTVAWSAMRRSLASHRRAEQRRRECERRYVDSARQDTSSPNWDWESGLFLHDLALISSEEQYALAQHRLQGYSIAETAKAQGMSPKRVRRLLKELFRTYLRLSNL